MGLTRSEQETIFRWDEEEQIVRIYSASPKTWRQLARLGVAPTKETVNGKPSGRFYSVPFTYFRWRLKSKGRGNPEALRNARKLRGRSRAEMATESAAPSPPQPARLRPEEG